MNRTEAKFADYLNQRLVAGEILWFKFEGLKFRLADNTFFTPDFSVMLANRELQCYEVKGFMMDDANVKIKVAASLYPLAFFLVRVRPKKDGGGFSITEIGA